MKTTTCLHTEISPAFGVALHSVSECMAASGAQMASAPIAVYLEWRASDCDMAVGYEVNGNLTPAEGCEWMPLPGGPHAFASHVGPYGTLTQTHAAIGEWCAVNGIEIVGPPSETYSVGPDSEPDPSKWRTDVNYPVKA